MKPLRCYINLSYTTYVPLVRSKCYITITTREYALVYTVFICFASYLDVTEMLRGLYLSCVTNDCVPLIRSNCYNVTITFREFAFIQTKFASLAKVFRFYVCSLNDCICLSPPLT